MGTLSPGDWSGNSGADGCTSPVPLREESAFTGQCEREMATNASSALSFWNTGLRGSHIPLQSRPLYQQSTVCLYYRTVNKSHHARQPRNTCRHDREDTTRTINQQLPDTARQTRLQSMTVVAKRCYRQENARMSDSHQVQKIRTTSRAKPRMQ